MSQPTADKKLWRVKSFHGEGDFSKCVDEAVHELVVNMSVLPETVTVEAGEPMALPSAEDMASDMLERLYEDLDDEYSGGEGDAQEPTPEIKAKAVELGELVRNTYKPWYHEPTEETVTVDLREWLIAHPEVCRSREDWEFNSTMRMDDKNPCRNVADDYVVKSADLLGQKGEADGG